MRCTITVSVPFGSSGFAFGSESAGRRSGGGGSARDRDRDRRGAGVDVVVVPALATDVVGAGLTELRVVLGSRLARSTFDVQRRLVEPVVDDAHFVVDVGHNLWQGVIKCRTI